MEKSTNRRFNYLSALMLLLSIIFLYLFVSYRKHDWVTGGLLLYVFLPILFVQAITILGFFISQKKLIRRLLFILNFIILVIIIVFYLIYMTKYN